MDQGCLFRLFRPALFALALAALFFAGCAGQQAEHEDVASDIPAEPFFIGSWSGVDRQLDEELYFKFDDGIMFLASPEFGYGAEFFYYAESADGYVILAVFDPYNEQWGPFFEIEEIEPERLMIRVFEIGELALLTPVDPELFENVYAGLEKIVPAMELVYGTSVETGLALDEELNLLEKRTSFQVGEPFHFFFDNDAPFGVEQVKVKVVDGESGDLIGELAYDVDPEWTALVNWEPFHLDSPGLIELQFVVGNRIRAVHQIEAE